MRFFRIGSSKVSQSFSSFLAVTFFFFVMSERQSFRLDII